MRNCADINWLYLGDAIPAFLTIIIIPFTYNIAYGLITGILTMIILKVIPSYVYKVHPPTPPFSLTLSLTNLRSGLAARSHPTTTKPQTTGSSLQADSSPSGSVARPIGNLSGRASKTVSKLKSFPITRIMWSIINIVTVIWMRSIRRRLLMFLPCNVFAIFFLGCFLFCWYHRILHHSLPTIIVHCMPFRHKNRIYLVLLCIDKICGRMVEPEVRSAGKGAMCSTRPRHRVVQRPTQARQVHL